MPSTKNVFHKYLWIGYFLFCCNNKQPPNINVLKHQKFTFCLWYLCSVVLPEALFCVIFPLGSRLMEWPSFGGLSVPVEEGTGEYSDPVVAHKSLHRYRFSSYFIHQSTSYGHVRSQQGEGIKIPPCTRNRNTRDVCE